MSSVLDSRIGLGNLGNTCFMNVVLQALRHTPAMGKIFLGDDVVLRSASKKKDMVTAFQTLMRDMWRVELEPGRTPTMMPRGFFHVMHNVLRDTDDDWHTPGEQSDSAEALQYVLDALHDGIYRRVRMTVGGKAANRDEQEQVRALTSWSEFFAKEYSPIVSNFNGQNQISIKCEKCGTASIRYEPWLMIKAPIPGSETVGGSVPSMAQCLNAAFETETLDDYSCDVCKSKERATITNKISRLPPVTILSLKRFTNSGMKVRGRVEWDTDSLDFEPWRAFARDPFADDDLYPSIYETYAVIEHIGSARGGHYRMYVRGAEDKWIEYDDESVSEVPPERVVSADSYVLFMMPRGVKRPHDEFVAAVKALRAEGQRAASSK
jgi:ubiquitin C-terminal hydrolase